MSKEVEAKFLVKDPKVFRSLDRLTVLGGFHVARRQREKQRNVYFDTEVLTLRKARAALKLRIAGKQMELTFKRELRYRKGVSHRTEMTVTIGKRQRLLLEKGQLNERLLQRLGPIRSARTIIGARPLRRVLTFWTQRKRLFFVCKTGRMELDLDRVRFSGIRAIHREVELENHTASAALFHRAVAALRSSYGKRLSLSRVSKYDRGLTLVSTKRQKPLQLKGDPWG